jgi:hypothetical protein
MKIKLIVIHIFLVFNLLAQNESEHHVYPLSKNREIAVMRDENGRMYECDKNTVRFKTPAQPFITLAVVFDGDENSQWRVQAETADGKQQWHKLTLNTHDIPAHGRHVTNMLILPANTQSVTVRVSTATVDIPAAEVHLFNPNIPIDFKVKNDDVRLDTRAVCSCIKPQYAIRTDWGGPAGQSNGCSPAYTNVTHQIVHHSDGNYDPNTNWAAAVKAIWNYHVNSNGWCDVGYNYLIAPNGQIFEGRAGGENVVGAHFCGKNSRTMGICIIGNYMQVAPSDTALASLSQLIAWKGCDLGIDPSLASLHGGSNTVIDNVSGHRTGCATDCPGDKTFALLPKIRTDARKIWQGCQALTTQHDLADMGTVQIYPNPTEGVLQLDFNLFRNDHLAIRVVDIAGRTVFNHFNKNINLTHIETLDFQYLAKGLYFVEMMVGTQRIVEKVVVR